ncbi:hypothetical protein NPIL_58851 [Nephila pilipes]|uniref:Uncharacterized protein n=1 Tax=Nephila pilipes TaxID=299642 RepID=A0A8X6U2I9_NEPPI|nr:hypothetical protein NPIL_58851 [Nephila pilipes]
MSWTNLLGKGTRECKIIISKQLLTDPYPLSWVNVLRKGDIRPFQSALSLDSAIPRGDDARFGIAERCYWESVVDDKRSPRTRQGWEVTRTGKSWLERRLEKSQGIGKTLSERLAGAIYESEEVSSAQGG